MANSIVPTEEDLKIAREGINMHINAVYNPKAKYSLEDFLENQAQVIAHLRAEVRMLEKRIKDK